MPLVAVFLLTFFLFSLVSRWVERTVITAPMVFALAGILLALGLPE